MYEELLENIAQNNGLREVNTWIKVIGGLGGITFCLLAGSFIAPLFIAVVLSGTVLLLARIPARTYFGLFAAPLAFALTSVLVVVLVGGGGEALWKYDLLPWVSVSVTGESLHNGLFVFSRVIGGMSALMFIALTTPMTDLFVLMRQCRFPETLLDLAMIIYRSIFMILDQLVLTYRAQVMRLGYGSFRESIRSFSTLCGSVFITSWEAGEDLVRAMDARCYDGKFAVTGINRPPGARASLALAAFLAASCLVVITTGHMAVIQV